MTVLAPEDRNCVFLVGTQRNRRVTRLPLVRLRQDWHDDTALIRAHRELKIGDKGYRKGMKPGNAGMNYDGEPIPSDEEIQAVMDAYDLRRACGRRDYAMIGFLRGTGLRINECLDFKLGDLDTERGTVLVRCGKGGKRAKCGITPHALRLTLEWIDDRRAMGFSDDQPLFPVVEGPSKGRKQHQARVRASLRTHARKAGVTKRVHPHCFRHALALDMARKGVPLPVISRQLRHSNVATTATYLRKLSDDEVFDAIAGLEWDAAPAPSVGRDALVAQIAALQAQLDAQAELDAELSEALA